MKNTISKLALAAFAVASISSCSLDEYNPSQLTFDETLTKYEGLKKLEAYCYQPLYGQLFSAYDFLSVAEGGTDCWLTPGSNPNYAKELMYYDGLTSNTNATNKLFGQAYSMINNCNTIINRAPSLTDATDKEKQILEAEARCLRAYYYSILVNYYGNITLNLEESSQNPVLKPKRSSIEDIYAQMVEDLKFAANNLDITPADGNRARVTKKTALGLLARVYAQGAGEYGLKDANGTSYWQLCKEVSEDLITNATNYGAYLYDDIEDMWAQNNNQSNKEALFVACGPNALDYETFKVGGNQSNIHTYVFPKPGNLSSIYPSSDKAMFQYGRTNNNTFAPSKYLLDCFDAKNDRRWEVSFTTAYSLMSAVQDGGAYEVSNKNYSTHCNQKGYSVVTITKDICKDYGIDSSFIGKKIYPYMDFRADWPCQDAGFWAAQVEAKVWRKGTSEKGNEANAAELYLDEVKNPLVVPYPLDADDDRFCIYLSKDKLSDAEKAQRIYYCINIDDLFENGQYRTSKIKAENDYKIYPGLNKYTWTFWGSRTNNLQKFVGDIYIMRMAEVYLLAAEANVALGNNSKAAEYIVPLRKRAARANADASFTNVSTIDLDGVFDEEARELCGEYQRWTMMKRHKDTFLARLQKGNPRAAQNFDPSKHYLRPISYNFLMQIENADEYGTNGY